MKKIALALALVLTGLTFVTLGCVQRTQSKVLRHEANGVPVVEISGALDQSGTKKIIRALRLADSSQPAFIVFTLDSRDGEISGALQIADTLNSLRVPTVVLVKQATGSSLLMVAAADQIYFSPDGVCGPVAPTRIESDPEKARITLKLREYLGSKLKNFAETNGHDADLFLAMTDPNSVLTRGTKVWKKNGELLSLSAPDALALGLSAGTAGTVDELTKLRTRAAAQPQPPTPQKGTMAIPTELQERYLAAGQIEAELRPSLRGNGEVLIGTLIRPDGVGIATRTPIKKDGSFATAVYPGRKLIFYAHGYDALVVERGSEVLPFVRDVGPQTFTPTPPDRLRTASLIVSLGGAATTKPVKITAELGITNSAYLYRDHGHRGGNLSAKVKSLTVTNGESLRFDGLSPIPYDLKLSAAGYVSRKVTIDPAATGEIALGSLTLNLAPVLEFAYVAQLDLNQVAGWAVSAPGTQKIICTGDTRFRYTEDRDKHRNQFYLRLTPLENGVEASFWANPCKFHNLGQGSLKTFLDNREWAARLNEFTPTNRATLRPGHVYFFQEPSRGTNCLFAVSDANPEAP